MSINQMQEAKEDGVTLSTSSIATVTIPSSYATPSTSAPAVCMYSSCQLCLCLGTPGLTLAPSTLDSLQSALECTIQCTLISIVGKSIGALSLLLHLPSSVQMQRSNWIVTSHALPVQFHRPCGIYCSASFKPLKDFHKVFSPHTANKTLLSLGLDHLSFWLVFWSHDVIPA